MPLGWLVNIWNIYSLHQHLFSTVDMGIERSYHLLWTLRLSLLYFCLDLLARWQYLLFFSDADASFTRQETFKLMGHEITQTTVRDELTCALFCLRYCSCQSFNLSKRSHNQYTCELNKATDKQFPGDLIFMAGDDVTYHMLTLQWFEYCVTVKLSLLDSNVTTTGASQICSRLNHSNTFLPSLPKKTKPTRTTTTTLTWMLLDSRRALQIQENTLST